MILNYEETDHGGVCNFRSDGNDDHLTDADLAAEAMRECYKHISREVDHDRISYVEITAAPIGAKSRNDPMGLFGHVSWKLPPKN